MKNATDTPNERFYQRLIANLYSADYENCGGNVLRANSFEGAILKAISKTDKLISVNKFDLGKDQIQNLYKAIGLIELLISFEDVTNLYSSILNSVGNYQFIIEQHHEDYIRQLNFMDLLIDELERIKETWHLRKDAVELFLEEYKELRKDEEEGFNENNIEEKNVEKIVSENAG